MGKTKRRLIDKYLDMKNKDYIKKNCLPVINMELLEEQLAEVIYWYDKKYCKSIDGAREVVGEYLTSDLSLVSVSLDEQSEATVCRCTTHWCMVMDKKTLTCSVNDFDCEERQTGN